MDLVYLYPNLNDAPAKVGKSILINLLHNNDLPFESIKIFVSEERDKIENSSVSNLEIVSFTELLNYKRDYIVHIPISPNVFPNRKFVLTLFCMIKKKSLIINYHGDIRKHFNTKLKCDKKIDWLALPSTILIPYILKKSTVVITHSNILNQVLVQDYGLENSVIIPNGIEDYWFEPVKKDKVLEDFSLNNDTYKIFYHGRLSSEKGVDLLIKATGRYIEENPNTILYIAGDGDQERDLKMLCTRLNISCNVVFLGNVQKETIKFFLNYADIAIYPSLFDNFPLSMLEAMACAKCPVYLSTNSGICDFIRKDGFKIKLIEPSVESIYEALSCKQYDLNLIKSQNMFAQKYRWKNVIKSYLDLYNEIIIQIKNKVSL